MSKRWLVGTILALESACGARTALFEEVPGEAGIVAASMPGMADSASPVAEGDAAGQPADAIGGREADAPLCGTTPCDLMTNTCCVPIFADAGATCMAGNAASCPMGEATFHCLQAADCSGAEVCCGILSALTLSAATTCQLGPCAIGAGGAGGPTAQLCKTNAECPNGDCVAQTCSIPNAPVVGGVSANLQLCGLQSGFNCTPM